MSPLLVDIAADALVIIMDNEKNNGLVAGVLDEYIEKGVNMLQYAEDTIFMFKDGF